MERSSSLLHLWFDSQQNMLRFWSDAYKQPSLNKIAPIENAVNFQRCWLALFSGTNPYLANSQAADKTSQQFSYLFYPFSNGNNPADMLNMWYSATHHLNRAVTAWQPFHNLAEQHTKLLQNLWQAWLPDNPKKQTLNDFAHAMPNTFQQGWKVWGDALNKVADQGLEDAPKAAGSFMPGAPNLWSLFSWYGQIARMFKPITNQLFAYQQGNLVEDRAEHFLLVQDKVSEYLAKLGEMQMTLFQLGTQAYIDIVQQFIEQMVNGKIRLSLEELNKQALQMLEAISVKIFETKEYKSLQEELQNLGKEIRTSSLQQWETLANPYPKLKADIEKVNQHNHQVLEQIEDLQKSVNAVQVKLMEIMVQATELQFDDEKKAAQRPSTKTAV